MPDRNRRITLAARPQGFPQATDFKLDETPVPRPGAGELLSRTIYLSLDPYMRGRMNQSIGYAPPVAIGGVMIGGTVAQVVESNLDGYQAGDFILCGNGWQEYALSNGKGVRKLDPAAAPISTALGVLGMPGHTAYVGLLDIGRPKPGETVVVSAAAGAVGAVGLVRAWRGLFPLGLLNSRIGFAPQAARSSPAGPPASATCAAAESVRVVFGAGGRLVEWTATSCGPCCAPLTTRASTMS